MDRFPLLEATPYAYEDGFSDAHQGVDLMAPAGSPVLAVESGQAWSNIEPKGGKVAYLQGQSGARYFYGHLSQWVLPLISATTSKPLRVAAGDELGKVGTTGNAEGRPPHVHFQVRKPVFHGAEALPGSETVDPFPELMKVDPKRAGKARASSSSSASLFGQLPQGLVLLGLLYLFTRKR